MLTYALVYLFCLHSRAHHVMLSTLSGVPFEVVQAWDYNKNEQQQHCSVLRSKSPHSEVFSMLWNIRSLALRDRNTSTRSRTQKETHKHTHTHTHTKSTKNRERERDVFIICVIVYDDLALEAWTQRGERERECVCVCVCVEQFFRHLVNCRAPHGKG